MRVEISKKNYRKRTRKKGRRDEKILELNFPELITLNFPFISSHVFYDSIRKVFCQLNGKTIIEHFSANSKTILVFMFCVIAIHWQMAIGLKSFFVSVLILIFDKFQQRRFQFLSRGFWTNRRVGCEYDSKTVNIHLSLKAGWDISSNLFGPFWLETKRNHLAFGISGKF